MAEPSVVIEVSADADPLVRFGASELEKYLGALFGLAPEIRAGGEGDATHTVVLGLASDSHVLRTAGEMPELSDQGHLVRRVRPDVMILAGGSSAAVCWAVYELVERFGVRYLLHEDVFPAEAGPFHLPDVDETFEPVQKIRGWRVLCTLPTGPTVWGLDQQRAFMNQIFKLKFNTVSLGVFPSYPGISYEAAGVKRRSGATLQGERIPIDADTIGVEHLGRHNCPEAPFLNNPEMVGTETFEEQHAAFHRLVDGIIDHAKTLGLRTALGFNPFEFPLEFRPVLENPTTKSVQLGGLTCAEQGDLRNPNHVALVRAKFEAFLAEYGRVDQFGFGFPEHAHADRNFRPAWEALSKKYGLEPDFDPDKLVASSREGRLTSGGPERAEREFKSVVAMLQFYDYFFEETGMLQRMTDRNIDLCLGICLNGAYEAPRFIDRVLWPGMRLNIVDYTTARTVRKIDYLEAIDASRIPVTVTVTLQDDNIGSLPQMATENIHILLAATHRLGWAGFGTRYWPIGDLDPVTAYLARASWDTSVTPRGAYEDHFRHVYGDESMEPFCQVMRLLEDAMIILEVSFLSSFFPVLGVMTHNVKSDLGAAEGMMHVRALYEQALHILERLTGLPGPEARVANVEYWIGRLRFAVDVLSEVEFLRRGGVEVHAAVAARAGEEGREAGERLARARDLYDRGIARGEAGLRALAANVRDDSDRGTLACYYHVLVREVKQTAAEFIEAAAGDGQPV